MVNRFWRWTSAPAPGTPATTGIPFGPLRWRAWTSAPAVSPATPAITGIPFGALRWRAWTSAPAIAPIDPLRMSGRYARWWFPRGEIRPPEDDACD